MKKLYLLPNVITAFGLACGLFVIFKVNMIEPGKGYYEVMISSTFLLLLAAFADFADGAVARVFRAQSQFGFQFDSLADAISFGVAPSVLLLKSLSLQQGSWLSFMTATGAMIYSLCGVLRLVRFNVISTKPRGDIIDMTEKKKHFSGLPIPAAAAAGVSLNLFFLSPLIRQYFFLNQMLRAIVLSVVMIFLGYLMVSRWKFPSLKGLHFRISSFKLVFITVLVAVCLLYGILYSLPILLTILSWLYISVAMTLALIRKVTGKKIKTLEDYDPDPDDDDELP
jgi:CDP-diacylglycerol--serine O-phosphatidyltransferase